MSVCIVFKLGYLIVFVCCTLQITIIFCVMYLFVCTFTLVQVFSVCADGNANA